MQKNLFNTKLICLNSGMTLRAAREKMQTHRIRHLPIVNEQNEIISILSSHDLTDHAKFYDLPADLFASSPVHALEETSSLATVALYMIEKKISSVLLYNEDSKATGIITTDDLLFQLAHIVKEQEDKNLQLLKKEMGFLQTAGDFFKRLSDIGI